MGNRCKKFNVEIQSLDLNEEKENGLIIVGDLTFSYDEFVEWLGKHRTECNSKGERVLYAIESFVSLEQHQGFFSESSLLFKQQYPKHYIFAMQNGGKNV